LGVGVKDMDSRGKWYANILCRKTIQTWESDREYRVDTFKAYFDLHIHSVMEFKQMCPHCEKEITLLVKPLSGLSAEKRFERLKRRKWCWIVVFMVILVPSILCLFLGAPIGYLSLPMTVALCTAINIALMHFRREDYVNTEIDKDLCSISIKKDGTHEMNSPNPEFRHRRAWKELPKQGVVN
jgi:hypothetical protein